MSRAFLKIHVPSVLYKIGSYYFTLKNSTLAKSSLVVADSTNRGITMKMPRARLRFKWLVLVMTMIIVIFCVYLTKYDQTFFYYANTHAKGDKHNKPTNGYLVNAQSKTPEADKNTMIHPMNLHENDPSKAEHVNDMWYAMNQEEHGSWQTVEEGLLAYNAYLYPSSSSATSSTKKRSLRVFAVSNRRSSISCAVYCDEGSTTKWTPASVRLESETHGRP